MTDQDDIPLWVRFDEALGTLALVDPATGTVSEGFTPGSHERLRTEAASIDLAETTLAGSGPTGRSVTLTLSLSFQRPSAGQSFQVEIQATDDLGAIQGFDQAGSIAVAERGRD